MKNQRKNHQIEKAGRLAGVFRVLPIIGAIAASGMSQSVFAVDRTWFGGTGDWGTVTNWTLNGVPGSSDRAIINSGSSTLSFDTGVAGLSLSGGTLGGLGSLSVTGAAMWTGGTITGAGTTIFDNTLAISGDNSKAISGTRIIDLNGTTTWGGNTGNFGNGLFFGNGTINNAGTFNDTNAFNSVMDTLGVTAFNNTGTYNKQGKATTTIEVGFNNTGTVNVDAGTLRVTSGLANHGLINVAANAVFHGNNANFANDGIIQGNGTIQTLVNNDLVNTGAINPGASIGHLTIDGDLQQMASGALNFELASLNSFDQLTVTDDVTLGGEIGVWNLGYAPVIGDSFVVATFDDRLTSSTFSFVSTHGFGSGVSFDVLYHEHDVTLLVTAVPEPEQYLMFLAGLGLMGAMARRRSVIRRSDESA